MFKIVWDKENNGVRLTMSSAGEALNIPPRPVFFEELDLLGLDKQGWYYPRTKSPLLWACERRYFYKGKVVLEVHGGNMFDRPTITITDAGKGLSLTPIDIVHLREINEDSMFIIEHEAMNFINDVYRRYKGLANISKNNPEIDFQKLAAIQTQKTKEEHVVIKESCDSFDIMPLSEAERQGKAPILSSKVEMFIASFSGGKDSAVMLDLVSRVIPSEDFIVIYSDTGYELPTSLKLYKEIEDYYHESYPELRFYTAKNHQSVLYYWDKMGSPSRIHRWCCAVMKSAPLAKLLKEKSGLSKQPNVILFDGVRAEESDARAGRSRIGKNVKHNNMINVSPILDWNSTEIYLYLLINNLPINHAYREGLSRVGCVLCPYSSGWSEDLCGRLYPNTITPFVNHIRKNLNDAKIAGVDNYIKEGKWKMRAGGRGLHSESNVRFVSTSPDFIATLKRSRENILMWLRVLGKITVSAKDNRIVGELSYQKTIYKFDITEDNGEQQTFTLYNLDANDIVFIGRIKRILYKTAYCTHCEVCEVECPTGALAVVPTVTIDSDKCIHCYKCLEFHNKGCVSAASITTSEVNILNFQNMGTNKKGINRYNDGMGMRENWLKKYFDTYNTFFDNDEHGLNPRYQIPPFINWLREAEVLNMDNKTISETGLLLEKKYRIEPTTIWEIIFINLCYNSEICNWFYSHINYEKVYTKEEMDVILQEAYPSLQDRTLSNPFNSLLNTFKESPIGNDRIAASLIKERGKMTLVRQSYNDLSLCATAYSLYRYAEQVGRKRLTISEFYQEGQQDGIYRQFGISRDALERKLRSLQEDSNRVLSVELNMGLDNILLRDDLNAKDILKLFLQ